MPLEGFNRGPFAELDGRSSAAGILLLLLGFVVRPKHPDFRSG